MLNSLTNKLLTPFGRTKRRTDVLYYQHDYGAAGYEEYRASQIAANKRKFDRVWAEDKTLEVVVRYIESAQHGSGIGICHGARNGWEVEWLRNRLGVEVIGTDISETANSVPHMVQHDFHDSREDWKGRFAFVYTNSLDQAFDPAKALAAWSEQLVDDGLIFVEHTMYHSVAGASETDPFGAHPMIMPYLFFEWGRGKYALVDILKLSNVAMSDKGVFANKGDVWVFVLGKPAFASARIGTTREPE